MFFKIVLAMILGTIAGTITGLVPGIHINLVSAIVLEYSSGIISLAPPVVLCVFIVAMGITHTFMDIIPSIFLGVPDPATALTVLPGHRMLLEGKGFEAVKLATIGSLICLLICSIMIFIAIPILSLVYSFIKHYVGLILVAITVAMIAKSREKIVSFTVFMLSGALGLVVLTSKNLRQPLFPMLSGMFGMSSIIVSLLGKLTPKQQSLSRGVIVSKMELVKAVLAGTVSGTFTAIMPGLGSAHAAAIASQLSGKIKTYAFMIMIGGVNTANFVFSLATLYAIGKARNGAVVVVKRLIGEFGFWQLLILVGTALVTAGLATVLTLVIGRACSKLFVMFNYRFLCAVVVVLIIMFVIVFSGIYGIIVFLVSTAVGLLPILTGIGRRTAMGCLLLPIIVFFLL